ncbi:MAG: GAF domain-containing protein, partial [Pirellulales bacterium]|nr:GAF domain-containing protein [Pirellulales bacterium]
MTVLAPTTDNNESLIAGDATSDPTQRRQAAVVAIGRRAMNPVEVSDLLGDAAALAAETLDADTSSVTELVETEGHLEMRLASVDEQQGGDIVHLPTKRSESLAGYALQIGHPLNISDLAEEQRFTDDALAQRGVRSAIACPLTVGGQLFGSIGVYSSSPDRFAGEGVLFVESVSHVVAATLARERAEEAQQQQAKFASAVLKTVESLVVFLDDKGRIAGANRIFSEVTGFEIADVRDRMLTEAVITPADAELIEQSLGKLRCGLELVEVETQLLTKCDGSRKVAWSFSAVRNEEGNVASYIASAIDITEQRIAEQELERARTTIASLKQAAGDDAPETRTAHV